MIRFEKLKGFRLFHWITIVFIMSAKLAAYSHSAADSPKKVKVQKHPQSSPTTHVTETSFLQVLNPPDHFGNIYIFDHFFSYIHYLDLVFFFNKFSLK